MRLILIITSALLLAACSTAPQRIPDQAGNTGAVTGNAAHTTPGDPASVPLAPASDATALLSPVHEDLWRQIRAELALERHPETRVVQEKLAFYRSRQEFLDRIAERARPYLYHIVQELKRRDMPIDLALLPIVESAFQPHATSRSRAEGIWQFIPSTGKRYGLKQNWWYDGRRDIVAATAAALDYLETLHAEFNDWLLALAAYNAGELNVRRALERNRLAGKGADFWSLSLPQETMGYVPSLLAVAELLTNADRYGVRWLPISNQPVFARVETDGQIDLNTAASLARISVAELNVLNPAFTRSATDPEGPHYLLIPVEKIETFTLGLASLPESERVKWNMHLIREGDTLGRIAERYHTSVDALRQTNGLRSNLIRAGHTLLIPTGPARSGHAPASGAVAASPAAAAGNSATYVVGAGDSLWEISRKTGVDIHGLYAANNLNARSILRPGQTLQLPAPDAAAAKESKVVPVAWSPAAEAEPIHYVVKKGDSLWNISRRYGVTVAEIEEWNGLARGSRLQPGQTLVVRPASSAQGA